MTPLTERQKILIINNVVRAVKDIEKLNNIGYKYLYLCSGFIAHYNRFGFIDYYRDNSLANDIIRNATNNQWRNFRPGDPNYEYMMAMADVYNRVLDEMGVTISSKIEW